MLKDARNLAGGANDNQTVSLLKDIQLEVYDLLEENRELRIELEEIKRNNELNDKLMLQGNHYYLSDDGPYCTNCWDANSQLIRVLDSPRPFKKLGDYRCPNCETMTN